MGAAVKWGVILAAIVTVLNVVWVKAALHTSPDYAMGYLAVVIPLGILAVVLALRAGAAHNPYGQQLVGGLVVGIVGGVLIFLSSWVMLSSVFPDTVPEQIAGFTEAYQAMDLEAAEKEERIDTLQNVTEFGSALQGGMGTLFTCLIAGAIAGVFLRQKG